MHFIIIIITKIEFAGKTDCGIIVLICVSIDNALLDSIIIYFILRVII